MIIKSEWQASTDPDDRSGLGSFAVGGSGMQIMLKSFLDFQAVCQMLDISYSRGFTDAVRGTRKAMDRELGSLLSSVTEYSSTDTEEPK